MLLDRLKAGSCLVISNLYICVIGHFKEQTVWFKSLANRNGLPRAGAKGKSTAIQRNTKARTGGGRYGGTLTAEPSCTVFGIRVCQRGERRVATREEELSGTEEEEEGWGKSESYCLAPSALLCPFVRLSRSPALSPSRTHTHREPAGVLCDSVTMVTHSNMEFAGRPGVLPAASRGQLLLAICLP